MSLEHTMPESFIGAVAGFEGVSDGYTAIHGPTGCKFYPASVSEDYYIRPESSLPRSRNPLIMGSLFFFAQPRVPCTYLDMDTFVTGASERLSDMMNKISELKPGFVAVMNSPGASLVGEDLTSIDIGIPLATMDHAEYSGTIADGYEDAVLKILETIPPKKCEKRKGTVNLVGLSISHLRWKDTVEDLTELLRMCDIDVNVCIGAGWSTDDIKRSAEAELNVLVYPEYGKRICSFYSEQYIIPSFESSFGAPIGFNALEDWVHGICLALGKDSSPALRVIKEKRRKTVEVLKSLESRHSLPKGRTYSLQCDSSTALAISEFLYSYLGMIPVAIKCTTKGKWEEILLRSIAGNNIPVSDEPESTEADIIISSGPVCASAVERKVALESITIEGPSPKVVTIEPYPPIGLKGTMTLLEMVLDTVARHHRFH